MSQTDMTAIAVEGGKGSAADMKAVQLARPEAGPGQILIKVAHAGVNRPDLIQRMGFYPPPPGSPDTMGLEVSGEVVTGAGRWKAGDQVTALLGGGGYAQYAVVDARHALPVPAGFDFIHAAALPETVFTVYANVFEHGALKAGETLRPRSADEKARLTAEIERVVWPWIAAGKLKPIIDATFPLADAAKAHAHLEAGEHVGKVVLVA